MAASTFYDNRRYLEDRYGIRIVCKGGRYSPEHAEAEKNPVLQQLLAGESNTEQLAVSPTLPGSQWIPLVIDAMQRMLCLRMEYASLNKAAYETTLSPYSLYPFRGYTYVVGHSEHHGETRTFALDRIRSLVLLPTRFRRPPSFSAKEHFRHSFGVFGGADMRPERIEIEVCPHLAAYLRQRPLHISQRELTTEAAAPRFEMHLAITDDFVREIFSHGADLRVVSPTHLCRLLQEKAEAVERSYREAR